MSIEERREAIAEIKAEDPDASTREIAGVLGVHHSTVAEDLAVGNPTDETPKLSDKTTLDDGAVGNPTAAKRKAGEISAALEKAPGAGGHNRKGSSQQREERTKAETLHAAGISTSQAPT